MEADPPDEFFELTAEDLQRLQAQAAAKRKVQTHSAAQQSCVSACRVRCVFKDLSPVSLHLNSTRWCVLHQVVVFSTLVAATTAWFRLLAQFPPAVPSTSPAVVAWSQADLTFRTRTAREAESAARAAAMGPVRCAAARLRTAPASNSRLCCPCCSVMFQLVNPAANVLLLLCKCAVQHYRDQAVGGRS